MNNSTCKQTECQDAAKKQGLCGIHYGRAKRSGAIQNLPKLSKAELFWNRVQVTGFCWEWTGRVASGRGTFSHSENGRVVTTMAHEYAYQLLIGPPTEKLDQVCKNLRCVNPDHLVLQSELPTMPLHEVTRRFLESVDKTATCWNWTGGKIVSGYGVSVMASDGKRASKPIGAHRVAHEIWKGPLPSGAVVDHICHRPECVNPDHIRMATPKQNAENHIGANRNSSTGVRGVYWNKDVRKFQAKAMHNYVSHSAGFFSNILDAEAAVISLRDKLFTHNID